MQERGIFRSVFKNNLIIMILFLFIALGVVFVLICKSYSYKKENEDRSILNEYVSQVNMLKENAVQTTYNIVRYKYVTDNIRRELKTVEEKYSFSENVNDYFESLITNNMDLAIYSKNDTLYKNNYLRDARELVEFSDLSMRLSEKYFMWSSEFERNEYGAECFVFYRSMDPECTCILKCTVSLPRPPTDRVYITSSDAVTDGDMGEPIYADYYVAIRRDTGELIYNYVLILIIMLTVAAVVIVMMTLLLWMQNKKITKDIEEFAALMENAELSELFIDDGVALSEGNKELQIIKRTVYELVSRVRSTVNEKLMIEAEKQRIEYQLLQSQINPHTLYNSLSAIKYNAFMKQDTATQELVENMVLYYRAVLNRGKTAFTVGEEMEMLSRYIRISEMSHDTDYGSHFDLDVGVMDLEIAHLFLQPFVENSIIHGLVGKRGDNKLEISGKMIGENVVFTIFDNGYGIDPDKLAELNAPETYNSSYGIKNAYRRMKFIYGDESSMKIESDLGKFTKVTLLIPADRMANAVL